MTSPPNPPVRSSGSKGFAGVGRQGGEGRWGDAETIPNSQFPIL